MVVTGLKYLYKILNECEIWFVFTIATLSTVPESSNPAGMYMYVYIFNVVILLYKIHKCDVVFCFQLL